MSVDKVKEAFKYYKRKVPSPSFDNIIDIYNPDNQDVITFEEYTIVSKSQNSYIIAQHFVALQVFVCRENAGCHNISMLQNVRFFKSINKSPH